MAKSTPNLAIDKVYSSCGAVVNSEFAVCLFKDGEDDEENHDGKSNLNVFPLFVSRPTTLS